MDANKGIKPKIRDSAFVRLRKMIDKDKKMRNNLNKVASTRFSESVAEHRKLPIGNTGDNNYFID